jgi:hypothetical protein
MDTDVFRLSNSATTVPRFENALFLTVDGINVSALPEWITSKSYPHGLRGDPSVASKTLTDF